MRNVSTILLPFCSDWLNSLLKNLKVKEKFDCFGSILVRATAALVPFRGAAAAVKLYSHAQKEK